MAFKGERAVSNGALRLPVRVPPLRHSEETVVQES